MLSPVEEGEAKFVVIGYSFMVATFLVSVILMFDLMSLISGGSVEE